MARLEDIRTLDWTPIVERKFSPLDNRTHWLFLFSSRSLRHNVEQMEDKEVDLSVNATPPTLTPEEGPTVPSANRGGERPIRSQNRRLYFSLLVPLMEVPRTHSHESSYRPRIPPELCTIDNQIRYEPTERVRGWCKSEDDVSSFAFDWGPW